MKSLLTLPPWLFVGLLAMSAPAFTFNELTDAKDVGDSFAFGEIADHFARTQPVDLEKTGEDRFLELLEKGHLHVDLGLFAVKFPLSSLGSRDQVNQLQKIALALLDAQNSWLHWVSGVATKKPLEESLGIEGLERWIKSWRARDFQSLDLAEKANLDFLDLFEADQKVRENSQAFASIMRQARYANLSREAREVTLVLAPTREQFVGLACFAGQHVEAARSFLWDPTIALWTDFKWRNILVLALEYADPSGKYEDGLSMNARESTGQLQHVVNHAMLQVLDDLYGDFLDPAFESGLATNVCIELFKEDNARVGGSGAAAKTQGRSKFVVGGNSSGGKLPGVNADSRWRLQKGTDHFRRALSRGFKDGRREADGRPGFWIALEADSGASDVHPVRAPFLGSQPTSGDFDSAYRSDAMEFFRAYASGFVAWLQSQALESEEGSPEQAFATLLVECAKSAGSESKDRSFESIVQTVYQMPLSDPETSAKSVEGRFLRTLAR